MTAALPHYSALAHGNMAADRKPADPPGEPRASFAALLNAAAVQRPSALSIEGASAATGSREQLTFGFSELGVFGLATYVGDRADAAGSGADATRSSTSWAAFDAQTTADTLQAGSIVRTPETALEPAPVQAARLSTNFATVPSIVASALPSLGRQVDAQGFPGIPDSSDDDAAPGFRNSGGSGKVLSTPPEMQTANEVNLVVSGTNDMLAISARSQGETAEDAAKIRRLFELTAAEFDMHIGEFRFNGSPGQPSARGGTLGSFTR